MPARTGLIDKSRKAARIISGDPDLAIAADGARRRNRDLRNVRLLIVRHIDGRGGVRVDGLRRLKAPDTIPQQDSNGNLAVKLLRTFAAQAEALQRYRGKGQQKVTVEHVHVHTGGQAIVGSVSHTGGGRDHDENRGQPHAPENAGAITFAPGTTLPSADKAREAMPVASGRR